MDWWKGRNIKNRDINKALFFVISSVDFQIGYWWAKLKKNARFLMLCHKWI